MNLRRAISAPLRGQFGKLLAEMGKLPRKASLDQLLDWGMV
jgi:hypothetical protein